MSCRRRKNRNQNSNTENKPRKISGGWAKGLWWKILIGVLIMGVIGGIFAYRKAIAFLGSEGFREEVSEQVSAELGTEGEFGKFTWSGMDGKNESFDAAGDGLIESVKVEDIAFDVKMDFIKRDKIRVKNIRVRSVYAEVDLRKPFEKIELPKKEKGFIASLLPEEIEILDAEVSNIRAKVITNSGDFKLGRLHVVAQKEGAKYELQIDNGLLELPFPMLKSARLTSGKLTQFDDEIYIDDVKLNVFGSGELVLNGVADLSPTASKLYDVDGKLTGLRCSDVVPGDWQRHLTGEVKGTFKIIPRSGNEPKITGHIDILDGQLKALPLLDTMAQYFSEDYRTVDFQEFSCDVEKYRDTYGLKNLKLVSAGLIQVEGDLEIDGEKLDGAFDVGIPAKNLLALPGAKDNVFKRGKDGLYWTRVEVGGVIGAVTNDLKDRMIQAAIDAGFSELLNITPDAAKKIIEGGLENGVPVKQIQGLLNDDKGLVKEGLKGAADAAKGLLNGITGAGSGAANGASVDDDDESGTPSLPGIPELPIPDLPELPKIPGIPLPF